MIIEYHIAALFLAGCLLVLLPARMTVLIRSIACGAAAAAAAAGLVACIRPSGALTAWFAHTMFSSVIALLAAFFTVVVVCFSMPLPAIVARLNRYYGFIFWTLAFSLAAVYSCHLVALAVCWGLSGLMLYLLAGLTPAAANAAKKSFIYIGGSDALILLGISLVWALAGTFEIPHISIALAQQSAAAYTAFALLAVGALTKAGAMPFHTWIPDFAETVPMPLTAFLPASLDKLLGIYLLAIITTRLFVLNTAASMALMLIAAVTIICAVFMAMVQHDLRRLLSYHAVSQVGYMVLGIAAGTPLGIAAGIFHMINHALYKSALFLTGAAVERHAGTANLDRLGGLSRQLPVTFIACLVASLSISGIPLFNGFVSKWMVYQALVQMIASTAGAGKIAGISFLAIALFGSALTLASFLKLLHAVFLGQPAAASAGTSVPRMRESWWMNVPLLILALLCIVFGVYPYAVPLQHLILPSLASLGIAQPALPGLWLPDVALLVLLSGILIGLLAYALPFFRYREDAAFIGGEDVLEQARVPATDFYATISGIPLFRAVYAAAARKAFDMYDQLTAVSLATGKMLSRAHTGSLATYLLFFLVGFAALFVYIAG